MDHPTAPAHGIDFGGVHEALRLFHLAIHWLMIPIEAGIFLWLSALGLALLAWAVWLVTWLVRRARSALITR